MISLVASWESIDKHTSISHLSLYWQMSDFAAMLVRDQSDCHTLLFSDARDRCCINACGNRILVSAAGEHSIHGGIQDMGDLSLSTIANIAEIIGAGSIITGLIFGWFQIRHFRAQQRNAVAINLMQTF